MNTPSDIEKIIEYGTKAPSGHNTQPWKFLFKENEIQIHPDFQRALPIVDADNHALYISLGCATENIVLALKNEGFDSRMEILKNKERTDFIKILIIPDDSIKTDDLFNYIERRQVSRNAYTSTKIPLEDLDKLIKSVSFNGINMMTFITTEDIKELEPFIIEANNRQFQNKDFVNELVSWIRFSKKEVEKKRDGIWHASMGMPSTGRFMGNIIMKQFVSAKSEAKRWKRLIDDSAGFALFNVKKNDVEHWVNLGRAFQRFGLAATKLNINHAHVNMPCEELIVRKNIMAHYNLKNEHPLLLIRFGYSSKMPYSFRRRVEEVFRIE
ncbi:MAG: hypothetical protein WBM92_12190 [Aureibaculum sp.]